MDLAGHLRGWTGPLFARGGQGVDALIPFLIIGGVLALVAVLAYVNYLTEKKRTEALKRVAEELGFDFFPKDQGMLGGLQSFHLFSQGHTKRLTNLMRGEAGGLAVEIFDYRYTVGGGKSSQTFKQTVICFRLDGPDLPAFSLRPENIFHRIGAWFGYQDINFDDYPEFSNRYLLRGPDEKAIRELFTDRVLAFFEGRAGLSTEGGGDRLLFYRHNKRVEPERVRSLLEDGFQVLTAFRPSDESAGADAE
jgi:hypothetical protein